MRRYRHAKIVATLGPSSSDAKTIRALFDAGADVFRLNFSHGDHAELTSRAENSKPRTENFKNGTNAATARSQTYFHERLS